MHVPPFILGILGGLAGVTVHAVLLVQFFSRSYGLFATFLHLVLALLLGIAALALAAVCRYSPKTLAVFLPFIGALGFFPRLLSWAPAGALLIAAGVTASLSLRSGYRRPVSAATAPPPGGAPLHWSEAARLGAPMHAVPLVRARERQGWSAQKKVASIAAPLVSAAVVLTLTIWSPGGPADSSASAEPTAVTTTSTPGGATSANGTSSPDSATPGARVTEAPHSTTTTVPAETGALDTYSDHEHGFSIGFPTTWRNTDPSEVGQRIYGGRAQAEDREYQDAYVVAAFADWHGPTYDGCFLDYIWVEVHDDIAADETALAEIRDAFEQDMAALQYDYPEEVRLLQPFHSIQVGTAAGFEYVWSVPVDDGRVVMKECVLVVNECVYYLQFAATEADWKTCQLLFQEILHSLTVRGSSPLI
ncbi:MAG: hypothetical protein A2133_11820 [Actinobacteria bacterium RBG_16_64_13]|nr:MAG: hypothetical protein A2133_11820 [Actinobacteria bacterium RBG_16_64_13]